MARYYVAFETVQNFSEIGANSSMEDLVDVLSKAKEFSDYRVRYGEKKLLNEMNEGKSGPLRWKLKGKVSTVAHKVRILILAVLGEVAFENWSLKTEAQAIFSGCQRIAKCMSDFARQKGFFESYKNSVVL